MSSSRIVRFGVPQGSVVAPMLFIFYVADAPSPPPIIFLVSYSNEFTVFAFGTDIETLSKDINSYLTTNCNFLVSRDLEVSTPKCSVTLFTPSTKKHKITPDVKINEKALILAKTPKILGVTFDSALKFGPHCRLAAARRRSRVNMLKALAATTWGQSKGTLIVAHQALIKPVLEYASPVWTLFAAQKRCRKSKTQPLEWPQDAPRWPPSSTYTTRRKLYPSDGTSVWKQSSTSWPIISKAPWQQAARPSGTAQKHEGNAL